MSEAVNLVNLPLDILVLIFPYLDARSFLSLCSTCKAFQQSDIRLDPTYWSYATRSTFRVPNRPVVQSDGQRWQRLYKRLLTQSKVYTWGQNRHGCLGHSYDEAPPQRFGMAGRARGMGHAMRLPRPARLPGGYVLTSHVPWPTGMANTRQVGVIADLQCGGWSTTLLNSKGVLYNVGSLNGQASGTIDPILSPLQYPSGWLRPLERYDLSVAIRQFSSGRSHILGVADSGTIWSWYDQRKAGMHVKFMHHDVIERRESDARTSSTGHVRSVVAGWNMSSAYITGLGIVLWEPINGPAPAESIELDTMLINETAVIPKTSYSRPKGFQRDTDPESYQLGETVGEVASYIVLEHFVIFVTDLHRLFCASITSENGFLNAQEYLELLPLQRTSNEDSTPCVTDVYGSFRSFAVLKSTGEVLTVKQDYLDSCWAFAFHGPISLGSLADLSYSSSDPIPPPADATTNATDEHTSFRGNIKRIPALQGAGVIAMAFGDYHFHALHSSGTITSYGTESQACGSMGFGQASFSGNEITEGSLRGLWTPGQHRDAKLLPHAYTRGRQIWFQPEKQEWLKFLRAGGKDPQEAAERMGGPTLSVLRNANVQGEVSEWIEQKGRAWNDRARVNEKDEDGLSAYFALSVAAAGWHSGALVLVNDKLAEKIGESCAVEDSTVKARQPQGPEPQEPEPSSEAQGSDSGQDTPLLSTVSGVLYNFARSFLGLPVVGPSAFVPPWDRNAPPPNPFASPHPGWKFVWADESFPRLRLTNGEEMAGSIEFSEWGEEGRPEWDLGAGV